MVQQFMVNITSEKSPTLLLNSMFISVFFVVEGDSQGDRGGHGDEGVDSL